MQESLVLPPAAEPTSTTKTDRRFGTGLHNRSFCLQATTAMSSEPPSYSSDDGSDEPTSSPGPYSSLTCNQRTVHCTVQGDLLEAGRPAIQETSQLLPTRRAHYYPHTCPTHTTHTCLSTTAVPACYSPTGGLETNRATGGDLREREKERQAGGEEGEEGTTGVRAQSLYCAWWRSEAI